MNPGNCSSLQSWQITIEGGTGNCLLCFRNTWCPWPFVSFLTAHPTTNTHTHIYIFQRLRLKEVSWFSPVYSGELCVLGFNSRRDSKKVWDSDPWDKTEINQELFATSIGWYMLKLLLSHYKPLFRSITLCSVGYKIFAMGKEECGWEGLVPSALKQVWKFLLVVCCGHEGLMELKGFNIVTIFF